MVNLVNNEISRAGLFKSRLTLTQDLNLSKVKDFRVKNVFHCKTWKLFRKVTKALNNWPNPAKFVCPAVTTNDRLIGRESGANFVNQSPAKRGNAKLKQAGNWYASENLWLRKYDCHLEVSDQ